MSWHEEDADFKARHIRSIASAHHLRPESVCDVGCGTGGVISALSSSWSDTRFVGYDVSHQAVELGRSLHPEIDIRLEDVRESDERYDLALMLDVFEHTEDCLGFLRSMTNIAQQFIFHIPLDLSAVSVLRERSLVHARDEIGHLHFFTKALALSTLREAGFDVKDCGYTPSSVEWLPKAPMRRKIASIPRRLLYGLNKDLAARALGGYSLIVLATVSET